MAVSTVSVERLHELMNVKHLEQAPLMANIQQTLAISIMFYFAQHSHRLLSKSTAFKHFAHDLQ